MEVKNIKDVINKEKMMGFTDVKQQEIEQALAQQRLESEQKIKEIEKFVKEAFCIDGSCAALPLQKLCFDGICIKTTDSKRGTFYVAIIEEKDLIFPGE